MAPIKDVGPRVETCRPPWPEIGISRASTRELVGSCPASAEARLPRVLMLRDKTYAMHEWTDGSPHPGLSASSGILEKFPSQCSAAQVPNWTATGASHSIAALSARSDLLNSADAVATSGSSGRDSCALQVDAPKVALRMAAQGTCS
jgi:hypothetical protein